MEKAFNLTGRTALVTGASRGIGRAIALGLARAGADVLVHAASRRAAADEVAASIRASGVRAGVCIADLAAADAPARIFQEATALLGRIDILVLNASVQFRRTWDHFDRAEFDQMLAVNFRASIELMLLAIPAMRTGHWGRILTLGSVQQTKPSPFMPVYAATKLAQLSIVRSYAKQLAPHGITINNLAPGIIETDRNVEALADADYRARMLAMVPAGRLGQPEDCAAAALLLCSDAGSYITGADLYIDGGMCL